MWSRSLSLTLGGDERRVVWSRSLSLTLITETGRVE